MRKQEQKQNKAKQSKAKQSKAKQKKTKTCGLERTGLEQEGEGKEEKNPNNTSIVVYTFLCRIKFAVGMRIYDSDCWTL
jgi:hypothetical protein